MLNINCNTTETTLPKVKASISIQRGFWQDRVLADTRQKIAELYSNNPQIIDNPKQVIIEFWQAYEGLAQVLGDKLAPFIDWFKNATSPETITRCTRALKEDGTILISHEEAKQRREQEKECRSFWGNEKRVRGNNGQ